MGSNIWRSSICGLAMAAVCAASGGHQAGAGVGPGARLLVTKAFPNHGRLNDEDFRQIADAGFTVAVRKWSVDFDNQPTLEHYVRGATKAGLDSMIWGFGLVDAADEAVRTLTRVGKPTRYLPPDSPDAWTETRAKAVEVARLSLEEPRLKGYILDFEIYDRNKTDGFCETYDDVSFTRFWSARGVSAPTVAPNQRHRYLKDTGQLDHYIAFQYTRVAEEAKRLRQEIDSINPSFQFGVYGWGALTPAVLENLATAEAPVLDLSAMTYGRTAYSNAFQGGYDGDAPDRPSLRWSLLTAAQEAQEARKRGYPAVLLAGHYPQSPGPADGGQPRYTARQAFNSAMYADGYWIWTDWVTPPPYESRQAWIDVLLESFARANAAVEAGDWTWSARQMDQVADPDATPAAGILTRSRDGRVIAWNAATGEELGAVREPPAGRWALRARSDVDTVSGPELVELQQGEVRISDPETGVVLLKFAVPDTAERLMIVTHDRLSALLSSH